MISNEVNDILMRAMDEVKKRHHEYLTLEHLLYAMLHDDQCLLILANKGIARDDLVGYIDSYLAEEIERLPEALIYEPIQTIAFRRVVEGMLFHVESSGRNQAECGDLMAAMFEETDAYGIKLLQAMGVTRLDILELISAPMDYDYFDGRGQKSKERESYLVKYATELVAAATDGQIDPVIGRSKEIDAVMHILCRRKKNNPLLIGEPGVGKTAVAEGLAWLVANNKVPDALSDVKIYRVDLGGMIAGTKYRGDFEKRLKGILADIEKEENAIIFIDEIHTLVGAGSTSAGGMDASNLLKPALANGKLRCIGATTFAEYRATFEKDRALGRRFAKVDVGEPSVDECYLILKGLKEYYESYHGVIYTDGALKAAAKLSNLYISDKHLPDKAIDLIDEAGAAYRLRGGKKKITEKQIEDVLAKSVNIPKQSIETSESDKLARLEEGLKGKIFGQDKAISTLVGAIVRSYAGLGNPNKPMGSFLFAGPTGVGKTEIAKELAIQLGIGFVRFDMSEYMEKHSIARLIGSPPGYVGHEQGGQLTEMIRKTPYTVLLLDEIEKANSELLNVFLQVMDSATLTDNTGLKADFKNVIIIMTSNLGSNEAPIMGFKADDSDKMTQAVTKFFAPEFRNRLDAIVSFSPLSPDVMLGIVEKNIRALEVKLHDKKVELEVSEEAKKWLAQKGYSKEFGARPLARVIQEHIADHLAPMVVFGELKNGGKVMVTVVDDKIVCSV